MDFFQQQDYRKRKSFLLICLFIGSLILIDIILCQIAIVFLKTCSFEISHVGYNQNLKVYFWVSALFFASVTVSILKMYFGYAASGAKFLAYLGAKPIAISNLSFEETQFKNCMDEMAIASGIPRPNLFIFEHEYAINAMASGYGIHDSAVAVTKGALRELDRDELQAILAHELGHILSGDTRINMFLVSALHSIGGIYTLGKFLLYSKNNKINLRGGVAQVGVAMFLMLVGSIGQFFSKLIKAAISRQREFLADALAVQFTRNSEALVSSLKKIGGDRWGSAIVSVKVAQASHMLFASFSSYPIWSALSTHPSIESRIKVYDKSFNGVYPKRRKQEAMPGVDSVYSKRFAENNSSNFIPLGLAYSTQFVHRLSEENYEYLNNVKLMNVTVCALYISNQKNILKKQVDFLFDHYSDEEKKHLKKVQNFLKDCSYNQKIGIQDLFIPKLKRQKQDLIFQLNHQIKSLIVIDEHVSLFELVAYKIFQRNCIKKVKRKRNAVKYEHAVSFLLSSLAHAGNMKEDTVQKAYASGMKHIFKKQKSLSVLAKDQCTRSMLMDSLDCLAKKDAYTRNKIMRASYACVCFDKNVSDKQASILRLLGEYMELPVSISSYEALLKA